MKIKEIRKTFLLSDILIVAAVVAAGSALLLLGGGWATLGGTIIAIGVAMLPFMRHGCIIHGHHGVYHLEEILVPREYQDTILHFLQGDTSSLDLEAGKSSGALVEIYRKRSDDTLLARYFDYKLHLDGTDFPIVPITMQQLEELRKFQFKPKVF